MVKVKLNIPIVTDNGNHVRGDAIEMSEGSAARYVELGWAEYLKAEPVATEVAAVKADTENAAKPARINGKRAK